MYVSTRICLTICGSIGCPKGDPLLEYNTGPSVKKKTAKILVRCPTVRGPIHLVFTGTAF